MKVAIFDFDKTLYNGYSRYDLGYAMEEASMIKKGFREELEQLLKKHRNGDITYQEKYDQDKAIFAKYYKGLEKLKVAQFIENEFVNIFTASINPWAFTLIEKLQEKKYINIVISGSWELLMEKAQDILGFDTFFSAALESKSNKLTGNAIRLHNAQSKMDIAKDILISSKHSIGLGDSPADLLFTTVTQDGFLYEPSKETLKAAKEIDKGNKLMPVTNETVLDAVMSTVRD